MTARLSEHARARCAEMGVPTKLVKRAVRDPEITYLNVAGRGRTTVVAGDLAVVFIPTLGLVVTVLWNGREGRCP